MVEALSSERMMRRPENEAMAEISSSALAFLLPRFCAGKTPIQGKKALTEISGLA